MLRRGVFSREIIEECDDFEHLLEREQYWIGKFNAVESKEFYNLSYGGYAGNSELLKEYWSSMTKEERQNARNWKPHFLGLAHTGDTYISKKDPKWKDKVSKGVKSTWDNYSDVEKEKRGKAVSKSRKKLGSAKGEKNPMYGRSIVCEKNLKWYTNGIDNLYITENTEPHGFRRGRTIKRKENV